MSVLLCCQALSLSLFAQQQKVDTAHIYSIPEIMVSDPYQTREVRSASPLQVFNKEELKNLQALQVSDVQSPNQKIPDRKTKCVIKTHINIKQNVIFGAKLKPV